MSSRAPWRQFANLSTLPVPKTRKPKFELLLKIVDLNNVPLVSGSSFIKWHLPLSASAEHRGRTSKCTIKDHKVIYDYEKQVFVRLTIDKNGTLQESLVHFEVIQEYSSSGRGERITLGYVHLNLAEFVDASDIEGEDGVCRRYLMQESKINSTLKIGISLKQIEGDRNYVVPPLRTAHVFGGIAGIMAGEQGENDDHGRMPSLNKKSKEHGELQDMYRRSLAAYWAAQPGELKADECIEDIFAGGDGWADKEQPYDTTKLAGGDESTSHSDSEPRRHHRNQHSFSSQFSRHSAEKHQGVGDGGVRGRGSLEQSANQMKVDTDRRKYRVAAEVDEFDIRDDLRSWKLLV